MMKSFFKKLAFVMALTMVVSMVTPAGAVFAADAAGIALQTAKSDAEILESDNIAVGATVDYKFYGAPANWKKMGLKWTSSNEAVATVAQDGKVTGVTDGVATIDLKSEDGSYAVSMKVVVGKGDMAYTYKQVSDKVATFIFKQDVEYTADDINLVKVFTGTTGNYEVEWPIESFSCEENVVAVAPYVPFADGDTYIIKIGADDEGTQFTTTLGEVDYVEVAWESLGQEKAFAKLTEDDEDIEVVLSVKLFSNGVDVTEAEGYDISEVEFELVNESDDFKLNENILVFEKFGVVAQVRATYTYDVDGEEMEHSDEAVIVSHPAPKYTIVGVDKWTIASLEEAEDDGIDWTDDLVHTMPAFEESDHTVVLLMTDSYGNKIVYPDAFAEYSELGDTKLYSLGDIKEGVVAENEEDSFEAIDAAEKYEIRYTSTNLNKIFVGTKSGEITTLGESKAPVIVSLYDENSEEEMVLVKNLFAANVKITEERKPAKIKVSQYADKILVDDKGLVNGFDEYEVKFTVTDQYGDEYDGVKVVFTADEDKLEKKADGKTNPTGTYDDGAVKYTFSGNNFMYKNSKDENVVPTSVKFTAVVEDYEDVKTTFTIKTGTPKTKKENGVDTLVADKWELSVEGKDVCIDEVAEISSDYPTLEKANARKATVKLYKTSNGLQVAYESKTKLIAAGTADGDKYLKDKKGEFSIPSKDVTDPENIYIVIYNPDGEAVSLSNGETLGVYEDGKAGKYRVVAGVPVATGVATDSSYEFKSLDEGTYTVKAYRVTKIYKDKNGNATDEAAKLTPMIATFKIENSFAGVTLAEQDYIDLSEESSIDTFEEVLFEAFDFDLGDDGLREPEDGSVITILDAEAKHNSDSGDLFIYWVKFAVPVDNDGAVIWYEVKASVNRSVKVKEGFVLPKAYEK